MSGNGERRERERLAGAVWIELLLRILQGSEILYLNVLKVGELRGKKDLFLVDRVKELQKNENNN